MDDKQTSIQVISVTFLVLFFILCCVFLTMNHAEKMSELGFCRTQTIGVGATLWTKCK